MKEGYGKEWEGKDGVCGTGRMRMPEIGGDEIRKTNDTDGEM